MFSNTTKSSLIHLHIFVTLSYIMVNGSWGLEMPQLWQSDLLHYKAKAVEN
jgi:hypothetical protein